MEENALLEEWMHFILFSTSWVVPTKQCRLIVIKQLVERVPQIRIAKSMALELG
jgi:hypothetical protein